MRYKDNEKFNEYPVFVYRMIDGTIVVAAGVSQTLKHHMVLYPARMDIEKQILYDYVPCGTDMRYDLKGEHIIAFSHVNADMRQAYLTFVAKNMGMTPEEMDPAEMSDSIMDFLKDLRDEDI